MKLFVTILEETCDAAIDAIRALRHEHDGVEVRAEKFASIDLNAIRAATQKPIILTWRSSPSSPSSPGSLSVRSGAPGSQLGAFVASNAGLRARRSRENDALAAGIDFVDVEWHDQVVIDVPERTVLSHHDYDGITDADLIFEEMRARGCAYTKLAATPQNFDDNLRLLTLLPGTIIGMGERGLYSRILAPFLGSELVFVAATNIAAPGQLTLERALEIYSREPQKAEKVFAVVGNPAGHSLSPSIHNRLFREKGVPAAYTIASVERFGEVAEGFLKGEPCGLSVTAPFKDDAYAFARAMNFDLGENAQRARAVNTLINLGGRVIADNTDVDGFAALITHLSGAPSGAGTDAGLSARRSREYRAAIVGAGGTARAARVACENAGIASTIYNRTASKGDAPLEALADFDGDLVINTLPFGVDAAIPQCRTYIEAAYGGAAREVACERRIGGLELLHAQAIRQHELFMKVFDGL